MPAPHLVHLSELADRPNDIAALRECLATPLEGDAETLRVAALELLETEGIAVLGRELRPAHWTSSAWLFDPDGWVLLMFHPYTQNWQQFGGHPDGDGCLVRVALRELEEESGLDHITMFDQMVDLDYVASDQHSHYDARYFALVHAGSHRFLPNSPEGHELRWVPLTVAPRMLEDERTTLSLERSWAAAVRHGLVSAHI
jgi:ADP-ribose pyrophosphatase YjhB (NUDIX family)